MAKQDLLFQCEPAQQILDAYFQWLFAVKIRGCFGGVKPGREQEAKRDGKRFANEDFRFHETMNSKGVKVVAF